MANNRQYFPSKPVVNGIVIVPENVCGHDQIIGDLHGARPSLDMLLQLLQPTDRLFIAGDLTDRGPDSLGVINSIRRFQKKRPGCLFVIKGNHEVMCLNAIIGLEHMARNQVGQKHKNLALLLDRINQFPVETVYKNYGNSVGNVRLHHCNGGDWLAKRYLLELKKRYIRVSADGSIIYNKKSRIKQIQDFMCDLPYIIHVQGKSPFNVVHADMPFSDQELKRRITINQFSLSRTEKTYATWAREYIPGRQPPDVRVELTGRNPLSIITYAGHSVISTGKAYVLRSETHTVNLDVAAYWTNVILVANHTEKSCFFAGERVDAVSKNSHLVRAEKMLANHLKALQAREQILAQSKQPFDLVSEKTMQHNNISVSSSVRLSAQPITLFGRLPIRMVQTPDSCDQMELYANKR